MIRQVRIISMAMLALVCLSVMPRSSIGSSSVEQFFEANQAYKNHRFQEAIDGYRHLIETGLENGQIYYNLGNAYFRRGDLGRAILSYERARLLIPRDGDLAFNLSHARNQTQDALTDLQMSSFSDLLGLGGLNRFEIFFAFALLNFLFFALLCIRLYKKNEWTYYLSIFLAIVIAIGACAVALKWGVWATENRAVVLSTEMVVHAGPDSKDTALFKLHAGTLVRVERTENDWTLVQLSQDKRGWARSGQLERIVKRTYP